MFCPTFCRINLFPLFSSLLFSFFGSFSLVIFYIIVKVFLENPRLKGLVNFKRKKDNGKEGKTDRHEERRRDLLIQVFGGPCVRTFRVVPGHT